ncbi:amino acid kinase [Thiorhodococcus fuscus]|uniref:Amino acid kinase n=1 Tax=Thiorhodococcus fuscus TaxID=527200 RepID=A0ABW4YEG9_9GAMM
MWVVKLGGSLADSERLPVWLDVLAGRSDLVLVPGGGPFADQVRLAQKRWEFADAAAHHLALLAMEQYGRMLCAIQTGFTPAASLDEIRRALDSGCTPVWMPVDMVLADPRIPQTWDMTSDSLAAWLSAILSASGLLLVKSAVLAGDSIDLGALARAGVVDRLFPDYAVSSGASVHLLSIQDPHGVDRFRRLLSESRLRTF